MYWIVLIILFIITQLEMIYFFIVTKEDDKSIKSLGRWMIELDQKIEKVIYDEKKETEEIDKILSDMLKYPNGDNPYQE